MSSRPELLALDFDGVLCNGLREYFQTAWQAHCQLLSSDTTPPPTGIEEAFYRLRPIVETGWEMPVIIHALQAGFSEAEILQDWPNIAVELLQQHQIRPQTVGAIVDSVRDHAIQQHLGDWLAQHTFYPSVLDRLQQVEDFVIISTKEGRFIQQLLANAGIQLRPEQLFGKEQNRPKYAILRELKPQYQSIWFIEDRWKTLETVRQHPDLNDIELFLADWGYNLEQERQQAQHSHHAHLISLDRFSQPFEQWV